MSEEQVVDIVELSQPIQVEAKYGSLTPSERSELEYQRKLATFAPGSPLFRDLKRSRRSVRVFKHHAMYWPTGAQLTENGNNNRRSRR